MDRLVSDWFNWGSTLTASRKLGFTGASASFSGMDEVGFAWLMAQVTCAKWIGTQLRLPSTLTSKCHLSLLLRSHSLFWNSAIFLIPQTNDDCSLILRSDHYEQTSHISGARCSFIKMVSNVFDRELTFFAAIFSYLESTIDLNVINVRHTSLWLR